MQSLLLAAVGWSGPAAAQLRPAARPKPAAVSPAFYPLPLATCPYRCPDRPERKVYKTTRELIFRDSRGVEWKAPAGTITDGASIPTLAQQYAGNPFDPRFLKAAVIHDAFCALDNKNLPTYRSRPLMAINRMFYEACLACGTPLPQAQAMYAAVSLYLSMRDARQALPDLPTLPAWPNLPTFTKPVPGKANAPVVARSPVSRPAGAPPVRPATPAPASVAAPATPADSLTNRQAAEIAEYIESYHPSIEQVDSLLQISKASLLEGKVEVLPDTVGN